MVILILPDSLLPVYFCSRFEWNLTLLVKLLPQMLRAIQYRSSPSTVIHKNLSTPAIKIIQENRIPPTWAVRFCFDSGRSFFKYACSHERWSFRRYSTLWDKPVMLWPPTEYDLTYYLLLLYTPPT